MCIGLFTEWCSMGESRSECTIVVVKPSVVMEAPKEKARSACAKRASRDALERTL
jgi:hypothetical protein